jgi:hypothetical protein
VGKIIYGYGGRFSAYKTIQPGSLKRVPMSNWSKWVLLLAAIITFIYLSFTLFDSLNKKFGDIEMSLLAEIPTTWTKNMAVFEKQKLY